MADIEDPNFGEEMSKPLEGGFQMPLHSSNLFPDNRQLFPDYTKDLQKFTQDIPSFKATPMPTFGATPTFKPEVTTPKIVTPAPPEIGQIAPTEPAVNPYKAPEPEKPWGPLSPLSKIVSHPLDFAGNFAKDATENVKGIAEALVKIGGNTILLPYNIVKDPAKYKKYWDDFMSDPAGNVKSFGSALGHALIDPYAEHGWDVLYEKPFTVLADAAAVLSLGAGSVGKAGKIAQAAGRLSEAERLLNYSAKINEVGHAIDPIQWGAKALKAVGGKLGITEAIGIGQESAELNRLRATVGADLDQRANNIINKINKGELVGETAIANELASERGLKGFPMFENEVDLVDRAAAARDPAGEIMSALPTRESLTFQDLIAQKKSLEGVTEKVQNVFKEGILENNPINAQKLWVKFATEAEKQKQFLDAALNHLDQRGLIKWVDKPEDIDRLTNPMLTKEERAAINSKYGIAPDWQALPANTYKKILDDSTMATRWYVEELEKGATPIDAARRAVDKVQAAANALERIKNVRVGESVAMVPKYIANYFDLEFGQPGRLAQWNDAILKHWKPAVTSLRPSYVPSVATSNAIMAIMAGVNPIDVFRASKLEVPAEVANKLRFLNTAGAERVLGSANLSKLSDRLSYANSWLDANLKNTIYKAELKRNILRTIEGANMTEVQLGDYLRKISIAPRDLIAVNNEIHRVTQEMMVNSAQWKLLEGEMAKVTAAMDAARGNPALAAKLNNQLHELADKARDFAQKTIRSNEARVELQSLVPGLQEDAKAADKAIETANAFTGAKDRLSPFEKAVATKLVPFYTYTKMISQLAFRLPFIRPKSYFAFNRMAGMVNDLWNDPRTPDWVRDYLPIGTGDDGQVHAVKITNLAPFNNIRTGSIGEVEAPGIFNPIQNPIIAIVYNMVGGIPQWSKRPVSPDEHSVRLGSGAVYRIGADGKTLTQTIAQPPLMRDVYNAFPFTQLLNEVLHPYMQTDRGTLTDPRPILNNDGQPKFPKEMSDILWSQLLRTTTYDPNQVKQQYTKTLQGVRKGLLDKIRMERDPELKAAALRDLQDLARQEEIRIKNH